MTTIGATEFRQRCLEILDSLGPDGITVTKRGKPVARVMPVRTDMSEFIGSMRGQLIVDPDDDLSTASAWAAYGAGDVDQP